MKLKNRVKRVIATMLMLVLIIGLLPLNNIVLTKAASASASLSNLGSLGTVKIGDKSESGNWYQIKVGGNAAFCLDLGLACHSGDTYESETDTYSSDSSNKKKSLEAYVGYWYDQTKNQSRKAWVYAQCLMWSIEEGYTSKSELTDVIKQVRSNTGYYDSKTAAELYDEIFGISRTVKCEVTKWTYSGSGASRQVLLQINSIPIQPIYSMISDTLTYRQRITIDKTDEFGNPVPHVWFDVKAQNYKELYSFKYNGWGDAETGDADGESIFEATAETNRVGRITFKFNYKLHSEEYAYVKDSDLENMTADDKKAMRDKMNEDGFKYANNLTKAGAEKLIQEDLQKQINNISNKYVVKEISSGDEDLIINSEYVNGKTVTITSAGSWTKVDGEWPETTDETYGDYSKATQLDIVNDFKKATITVNKVDKDTGTYVPQGEGALDGAEYRLFDNSACTQWSQVYDANGNLFTPGTYVIRNGKLVTDYLECGKKYYLKEVKAPTGYNLDPTVHEILESGANFTQEFNAGHTYISREEPVKGQIEIIKKKNYPTSAYYEPEPEVVFQIFLKKAGSYDKAKETERDILYADEEGYAISKKLPYGTYVVHQLDGDERTEFVADFDVVVAEHGKVYRYTLVNMYIPVYLKIVKKDLRTGQTVLKPNTTYQIYEIDRVTGEESLVTQTYYNGTEVVSVSEFRSDDTGEIITPNKLLIGRYKIKEIESAEGLHNSGQVLDIHITKTSYETKIDANGNEYNIATVEYYNDETKGKFTLDKRGFALTSFVVEQGFSYESITMPGTTFEIFAKEDIETQDNQGTYWFKAGDKVATITTGKIVEFTDDCNGICTYNIEEDGSTTMYLPLGKYELKEVNTLYSYFLPEVRAWDLEFKWSNQDEEYVFNITDVTNDEGILNVQNELVQTDVSMHKSDKDTNKPVKDAVFGFYTRDDIYNAKGEVIVKKGEKIATVTTNEEGVATLPFSVPLMSEGYKATNEDVYEEQTTEEAATVENEGLVEDVNAGLNSGNYYWKEESVSNSYYLDEIEVDVHLEYKDQDTDVIVSLSELPNTQTETTIGKLTLTGSIELSNCNLKISDAADNDIITWTSGVVDSIWITDKAEEFGYRNLTAAMDEKGNLVVKGLFHDEEYKLIETKPCDGYATAEDIIFKLVQGEKVDEAGNKEVITTALVKDATGNFIENTENKVLMYDDTTKIEFSKTDITGENEVPGCDMEVTEKDTGVVMDSWTSGTETHIIEGKYVVGKTYVLTEKRPASGFATADNVEFTVSDTREIQKVSMKDETIKVEFYKIASDTNKLLGKAKFNVYDSSGKKVYSFTTNSKAAILIKGIFTAGETYRFVEAYTPKGYETAAELEYTVKDTGEIQKIEIIDEKTPDTPKTGIFTNKMPTIIFMGLLLVAIIFNCMVIVSKRKKKANA